MAASWWVVEASDEELFGKLADDLVRFASTLVDPSSAEDVVVGAFVRVVSSPAWVDVMDRRAYLFRAVMNEARGVARSDRRRLARERAAATMGDVGDSGLLSVEVRDAVNRLSLRERSVLYLAYWHDLPVVEIASTLGLSARSVERALTSARRRLEDQLS